jgi:hypothetical protein
VDDNRNGNRTAGHGEGGQGRFHEGKWEPVHKRDLPG